MDNKEGTKALPKGQKNRKISHKPETVSRNFPRRTGIVKNNRDWGNIGSQLRLFRNLLLKISHKKMAPDLNITIEELKSLEMGEVNPYRYIRSVHNKSNIKQNIKQNY